MKLQFFPERWSFFQETSVLKGFLSYFWEGNLFKIFHFLSALRSNIRSFEIHDSNFATGSWVFWVKLEIPTPYRFVKFIEFFSPWVFTKVVKKRPGVHSPGISRLGLSPTTVKHPKRRNIQNSKSNIPDCFPQTGLWAYGPKIRFQKFAIPSWDINFSR